MSIRHQIRHTVVSLLLLGIGAGTAGAQTWSLGGIQLTLGESQQTTFAALKAVYSLKLEYNNDSTRLTGWTVTASDGAQVGAVAFGRDTLISIERWYARDKDPLVNVHTAMVELQALGATSCAVTMDDQAPPGGQSSAITCGQFRLVWNRSKDRSVTAVSLALTKKELVK